MLFFLRQAHKNRTGPSTHKREPAWDGASYPKQQGEGSAVLCHAVPCRAVPCNAVQDEVRHEWIVGQFQIAHLPGIIQRWFGVYAMETSNHTTSSRWTTVMLYELQSGHPDAMESPSFEVLAEALWKLMFTGVPYPAKDVNRIRRALSEQWHQLDNRSKERVAETALGAATGAAAGAAAVAMISILLD